MEGGETRGDEMSGTLGLGKVSREVLRRSVFPFIPLDEEPSLDGGMTQLDHVITTYPSPQLNIWFSRPILI